MPTEQVSITVNGRVATFDAKEMRSLAAVLREEIGLTGVKVGCGVGECGACSVLVDGRLMSACLLACQLLDGSEVWTIEGLTQADPVVARLQEQFVACGALQCGFCTPGQITAARALLGERDEPDRSEIASWMAGNLCRCTGYEAIIEAVRRTGHRDGTPSSELQDASSPGGGRP